MTDAVILYSNSSHGVYIPQHFAQTINREYLINDGAIPELDELLDWLCEVEPDADFYIDEWNSVLDNVQVKIDGHIYRLWHDCDLWLYCEELMTEEEKQNFFEGL